MRLSGPVLVAILLLSSFVLAQHGSGGGGSSPGSSSGGGGGGWSGGGGGGSHGAFSGGSGSSGGSSSHGSAGSSGGGGSHGGSVGRGGTSSGVSNRSSAGSTAYGSSGYPSRVSGAASSLLSHSTTYLLDKESAEQLREMIRAGKSSEEIVAFVHGRINTADNRSQARVERPEKRGFFSVLRHPFQKPGRKPVADLWLRSCVRGWCRVCAIGAKGKVRCTETIANNLEPMNFCSHRQIWSGDSCLQQTNFLHACSGLLAVLERQAKRRQAADSAQLSACSAGITQECTEATSRAQSESSLYQSLQEKYQQCRRRAWGTHSSTGQAAMVSPHPLSDLLQTESVDH